MIVILWVVIYQHFHQMDDRFFYPSFQGMKGLFLYEFGDYKSAAKVYKALFSETDEWGEPSDPGVDALLRGDLYLAESIAQSDLVKGENQINATLTLGEVALSKGKHAEALQWFNEILKSERDQFDALILSSVVQSRLGRDGEAITLINRALRYHKIEKRITTFIWALEIAGELSALHNEGPHHTLLAHYFRYLRIFDKANGRQAMIFAKKGIKIEDHREAAHLTLGIVLHKENRIEKALEAYQNAIKINPAFSEAYRRKAHIYSDRGDLANEYQMIKAAYEADSRDIFSVKHYQDFLTDKLGDYYQALVLTEQLLDADPENIDLIKSAAFYLRFIGKEEKAIEYYKKGLEISPKNASLYEGLGFSYTELEQFDAAFEAFQSALLINDQQARAYAGLAFLYDKTNKKLKAIEALEAAFAYGYQSNTQRMNLCTLYYTESQFEKAERCLRRVLTEEPRNVYAGNLLTYTLKNVEVE